LARTVAHDADGIAAVAAGVLVVQQKNLKQSARSDNLLNTGMG
jgi:hypothetical protein